MVQNKVDFFPKNFKCCKKFANAHWSRGWDTIKKNCPAKPRVILKCTYVHHECYFPVRKSRGDLTAIVWNRVIMRFPVHIFCQRKLLWDGIKSGGNWQSLRFFALRFRLFMKCLQTVLAPQHQSFIKCCLGSFTFKLCVERPNTVDK